MGTGPRCAACGYDKTGLVGQPCPECGSVRVIRVDPAKKATLDVLLTGLVFFSPGIAWFVLSVFQTGRRPVDGQSAIVFLVPCGMVPIALFLVITSVLAGSGRSRIQGSRGAMVGWLVLTALACVGLVIRAP